MPRIQRVTLSRLAILVVLYPWIVSYAPVDSLVTELGLSVGIGREVRISRDCDGNIIRRDELPFNNVAASLTHQLSPEVSLGLAAGYATLQDDGEWFNVDVERIGDSVVFRDRNVFYVKPSLMFDLRYLGASFGAVLPTPGFTTSSGLRPTFSLRVGSRQGFAWETNYMHHDLLIGPAWFSTGFAFAFPVTNDRSPKYARLRVGIGGGPSQAGVQMSAEIPLGDFTLDPGFFVEPEEMSNGFFARLRYRLNAPPSP
jgi:hypothetical protein